MVKRNQWIVVIGVGTGAAIAAAGPLNPPAGPVAPTYKTLTEVEPRVAVQSLPGDALSLYVISQPGSYYLTGDIVGVPDKHAIRITAPDVTLDLMGFTVAAPPAGPAADDAGIIADTAHKNLTVRNGSVRGWNGGAFPFSGGVNLRLSTNCRLEDLRVSTCSAYGIQTGPDGVVRRCEVEGGGWGIQVESRALVTDCVVRSCSGRGINVNGDDALIQNCQVIAAGQFGIRCMGSATVTGCYAALCNGAGIRIESGLMTGCTASANSQGGLFATGAATISGCVAELNGLDGITVISDSQVVGNTCHANGQAPTNHSGIFAAGSDNRIEGNACTDNNYGVYTETNTTNLVVRNSTRSNSVLNFRFGAGTVAGPVVTGATIAGSSNPHANYEF